MNIMACFAYDDLRLVLSSVQEIIALHLKTESGTDITVSLHPMQCKILGESLINASGKMQINQKTGSLAGSMQVEFDFKNEREDIVCQQQNLSVQTVTKSISRIA